MKANARAFRTKAGSLRVIIVSTKLCSALNSLQNVFFKRFIQRNVWQSSFNSLDHRFECWVRYMGVEVLRWVPTLARPARLRLALDEQTFKRRRIVPDF